MCGCTFVVSLIASSFKNDYYFWFACVHKCAFLGCDRLLITTCAPHMQHIDTFGLILLSDYIRDSPSTHNMRDNVQHCNGTLLWYLLQLGVSAPSFVVASLVTSLCECVGKRQCFYDKYIFRKRVEGTPSEPQNPERGT
jgi:hypothetical protein